MLWTPVERLQKGSASQCRPTSGVVCCLGPRLQALEEHLVLSCSSATVFRHNLPLPPLLYRTREDTVRCIVASLIDDSGSDLADVGVH